MEFSSSLRWKARGSCQLNHGPFVAIVAAAVDTAIHPVVDASVVGIIVAHSFLLLSIRSVNAITKQEYVCLLAWYLSEAKKYIIHIGRS